MEPAQTVNATSLAEKEKYFRFEKISEIFTYLGIFSGFFLTLLSYTFPIDRRALYLLFVFVFIFAFFWFRLLPKKYTGLKKTLIYYFCSIFFVAFAVHFTNGIQSFAIFFFYLTILGAAASLPNRHFSAVVGTIALYIILEAVIFSKLDTLPTIGLVLLQVWSMLAIAIYGRFIFDEEKSAKASEITDRLKVARQIDLVKNEFVFVISNKLRTPILSLQNYLESAFKAKDNSWSADFTELLTKTKENNSQD
jgi:hypothetical protein